MKTILFLLGLLPAIASAQSYTVDWYKISGGGGASTGAIYQVTGTIGQPDAGIRMTGGNYSLTGGFWSLIGLVQTASAPKLSITYSGNNLILSWPVSTTSFALQQNAVLGSANWTAVTNAATVANSTSQVIISPFPTTSRFYRLGPP